MSEWSVSKEEGLIVWRFPEEMDPAAFGDDELWDEWERILREESPETVVVVNDVDAPFSRSAFSNWIKAAKTGYDHGVRRWAVSASGLTKLSLVGQLGKVSGIEVEVVETERAAFEWAKSGDGEGSEH